MLITFTQYNLSPLLTTLHQAIDRWAGIPWYVWLVLFLFLVLFLWWRLSRSAAQFDEDAKELAHDIEEIAHEQDEGDLLEESQEEVDEVVEEVVDSEPVEEQDGVAVEPDDLTKIEGIGPKISSLLQDAGINTYSQLADTSTERLDEIVDAAGLHMANAASWPEQAKLAADGKWDDLAQWQDELKGGRHPE